MATREAVPLPPPAPQTGVRMTCWVHIKHPLDKGGSKGYKKLFGGDDAARKELLDADAWRRDLVRRFLENYDRFAEENAGFALEEPSPLLEALEALYAALEGATDGGDDAPAMTWRKAEDRLAALAPRLAAAA